MHFTASFIVLATGLATLADAVPADVKVRPSSPFIIIYSILTQVIPA
jgi:hypothetical protein